MINRFVLLVLIFAIPGAAACKDLLIATPVCDASDETCLTVHAPDLCQQLKIDDKKCHSLSPWNARGDKLAPKPFEGAIDLDVRVKFEGGDAKEKTLRSYTTFGACGDPSLISYKGESPEGYPLIETDAGIVELIAPDLEIGYEGARLLIDANSGEVIGKLTAPHDAIGAYSYYFRDSENIFLFTRERCLIAPGTGRGRITAAGAECDLPQLLERSADKSGMLHDIGLTKPISSDVKLAGSIVSWAW